MPPKLSLNNFVVETVSIFAVYTLKPFRAKPVEAGRDKIRGAQRPAASLRTVQLCRSTGLGRTDQAAESCVDKNPCIDKNHRVSGRTKLHLFKRRECASF